MLTVSYGGRYATYDYLDRRGLFSPRVDVTVTPSEGLRLSASASRRAHAPGAEEFLPPGDFGIWLPPQRTFSSVEAGQPFQAQRSSSWTAGAERDFGASTVSAKVYAQQTDNQLIAIFGADVPGQPTAKIGHYLVANAGDAEAFGYTVGFKTVMAGRVHGSVDYSTTRAKLDPAADLQYLLLVTPSAARSSRERLHDITTLIEASVPETATRVLVLYRIGNGYARPAAAGAPAADRSRVDSRFDVQVRQALPFLNFSGSRWEMLLAVRNYFREAGADQVVYDELLVVRPPKRIVGGVTMHF